MDLIFLLLAPEHAGADQPVDHAIPASANMAAESADDLPGLPAFQVVAHGVVDVGQQLVGGPGICGPDRPVVPDRQLPADGQLGQERARQADLDESVAPGGNMSLVVHRHQQQHLGDQHDWHAKCPPQPHPGPNVTNARALLPRSRPAAGFG